MLTVVRLVAGDGESAIEGFAENFRNYRYHSWCGDMRHDPRCRTAFEIELDRVAFQRKLLGAMRD